MKAIKWLVQGLGIGSGIVALHAIVRPGTKKVPRWMFTEHDKVYGEPWSTNRSQGRLKKVVASLDRGFVMPVGQFQPRNQNAAASSRDVPYR